MKSFKEYIKDQPEKEEVFISNSHGRHAQKPEKKEVFMSNSHGRHAQKPTKCDESVIPHISEFLSKNDNGAIDHDNLITKLEKDHPKISDEGKTAIRKYTSSSSDITSDLLNTHKSGHPVRNMTTNNVAAGLDKHTFTPLKHKKLHTYSGTNFDITDVKPVGRSKEGNPVYYQPTYMSSSVDKRLAKEFADYPSGSSFNAKPGPKHILHWHHDEGHPIGVFGNTSTFPEEREIGVPRTESTPKRYHIEHLGRTTHKNDLDGNTYHVDHVRRIPESEVIKD